MNPPVFTRVDDLEAHLRGLDRSPSDEEGLTELEHLLQCADVLREAAPDDQELQVAGLLHDIGFGAEVDHGEAGAAVVRPLLGKRVAELVRLHVDAKRYLVTRDADYRAGLSATSLATLIAQGGDLDEAEVARFESNPFWRDALRLRQADDLAKVQHKITASLESWLPVLRSAVAAKKA